MNDQGVSQGSSDGGAILLKADERRYGLLGGLAGCLRDQRQAGKVDHPLKELLAQRVFSIRPRLSRRQRLGQPRRRSNVGIRLTPSFICDEELLSSMHDDNESSGTVCTSEPGGLGRDR
jgi:hypothetical protein